MDDAVQIRDDEHAEIEPRILVALHDAWPSARDIRLGEIYRPAGRYTGPSDAPRVIRALLDDRVGGQLSPIGLVGGRLTPATPPRLVAEDESGTAWVDRLRAMIDTARRPRTGQASAVRAAFWT